MFDELHIRSAIVDGEDYVNVMDLARHISAAMNEFAREIRQEATEREIPARSLHFAAGIAEGMREIAVLLSQGSLENRLEREVNTLDDLIKMR